MLTLADTRAQSHWLLELDIDGSIYRFATSPVDVTDEDGNAWHYEEGLVEPAVSLVQDGAAEQTAGLVVESLVDWALLEALGHSIERAPGVLRRWREGQVLERARVYLRGLALSISYGEAGEPLGLTLTRAPSLQSETIPDPQAVITEDTWPVTGGTTTADRLQGVPYPIPIGCPGNDPSTVTGSRPGCPAPMVEWDGTNAEDSKVLVSLGRVQATQVALHNVTAGAGALRTQVSDTDGLGRTVTTSQFTALASNVPTAESDEMWSGFSADDGGGLPNPFGTGPLRGAGDVAMWALTVQSGIRVDRSKMAAHAPWLNRYKVDTYINKPTKVWDWFASAVLPWLPVMVRESDAGLYLLPVRWDYTDRDVVHHLDAARNDLSRASDIQRLDQPVYNEVTVRYRPSLESGGKWYSSITVTAQAGKLSGVAEATDDARIVGSFAAERSQRTYGVVAKVVDIRQCWDDTTAALVAQQMVDRYALPKRTVSYVGGPDLAIIEPGEPIILTDSRVHLSSALCLVVDTIDQGQTVQLDLVILDNPLTSTTSTESP